VTKGIKGSEEDQCRQKWSQRAKREPKEEQGDKKYTSGNG